MSKITFLIFVLLFSCLHNLYAQDTLIIQTGPTGKYANLWTIHPDNNYGHSPVFHTMGWTFSGEQGVIRSIMEPDLSAIPPSAIILEARLSLYYGSNQPNYVPHTGQNASYLRLITSEWNEETVTWNTSPETTIEDQVYLPESTEPEQAYTNLDVTIPITKMYNEPENYHGLMLKLITEYPYACLLFASGANDAEELRPMLVIVYSSCVPPAVDFDYTVEGQGVSFTGISPTAINWHWDFGDGDSSNLQNPGHVYLEQGIYQVCLSVADTCSFAEHCEIVEICDVPPPVSEFTYLIDYLTVYFQDSSILADEYNWDFGDGYTSNLSNPWHNYESQGEYQVCLITRNSCGSDTACEILNICGPVAGFSYMIDSLTVFFDNISMFAEGLDWDFGDGYHSSLDEPSHTYNAAGNYLVCLKAENACGSDTLCKIIELSIESITDQDAGLFRIYPNPARDMVCIKLNLTGQVTISLLDLSGKELLFQNKDVISDETIEISLGQVESGIYIIRLDSGENQFFEKLVIAR